MKKFDRRLNPIGRNGQPLQCRVCKSIAHFERNCPNRKRSGDTEGTERNDHFLASSVDDEGVVDCKISDIYVGDAFNHMILNTGCPHNVAGKIWVDCFFEGLSNEELKLVEKSPSTTKFKFGGGRVLQSLYRIQAYNVVYVNRLPTLSVIALTGREVEILKALREMIIFSHLPWMMKVLLIVKYLIYMLGMHSTI